MKHLYLLFRLFKCPHKYNILKGEQVVKKDKIIAFKYFLQCSKCGKITKSIIKN